MKPGALGATFSDRPSPMGRFFSEMTSLQEFDPKAPGAAQFFGGAGVEYAKKYDTRRETLRQDRLQGPHPRAAQSLRHLQGPADG
ncbi:MAG: hypothetical protein WDM85_19485 [Caulobacteraceae bacterium]